MYLSGIASFKRKMSSWISEFITLVLHENLLLYACSSFYLLSLIFHFFLCVKYCFSLNSQNLFTWLLNGISYWMLLWLSDSINLEPKCWKQILLLFESDTHDLIDWLFNCQFVLFLTFKISINLLVFFFWIDLLKLKGHS